MARNLERERYWREVVNRQERSGLSIAAFCRDEGVSQPSFFNWRRKLREDEKPSDGLASPRFLTVDLPVSSASSIELEHGDWRVIVPPTSDVDSLRSVVSVLADLATPLIPAMPEERTC